MVSFITNDVLSSLQEDLGSQDFTCELDVTTHALALKAETSAKIITRENGVLCGTEWADEVFKNIGSVAIKWFYKDGDLIEKDSVLCELNGSMSELLVGERAALNFLQLSSGVATKTRRYVAALDNSNIKLLDTRKTIPSLRHLQKKAVVAGGGDNHRMGLYDAFLIKENHIKACGGIKDAVAKAKSYNKNLLVEVEVESIAEFKEALAAKADVVLLDNFKIEDIKKVIQLNNSAMKLEVSGNINLFNIRDYTDLAIDFISIGDLTKNIEALDLSMLFS